MEDTGRDYLMHDESATTREWKMGYRWLYWLLTVSGLIQAAAGALLLLIGESSGISMALLGLGFVGMVRTFWASRTSVDPAGVQHHEPIRPGRSFEMPWSQVREIRTATSWRAKPHCVLVTTDGRDRPLYLVPAGEVELLRRLRASRRPVAGSPATGRRPAVDV